MRIHLTATASLLLTGLLSAQPASAVLIQAEGFDANDCSGFFGQGFDSCQIFNSADPDADQIQISPVIAKFSESLAISEINSAFSSVTGSEWAFSNTGNSNGTGTWTYTPGTDDPGIRYWAAKASNDFILYWDVDQSVVDAGTCSAGQTDMSQMTLACLNAANVVTTGDWTTPLNSQGSPRGLSHITFYDSDAPIVPPDPQVPAPAAIALLGLGLVGFGIRRRRK